jgi:hypothetical protein
MRTINPFSSSLVSFDINIMERGRLCHNWLHQGDEEGIVNRNTHNHPVGLGGLISLGKQKAMTRGSELSCRNVIILVMAIIGADNQGLACRFGMGGVKKQISQFLCLLLLFA